MFSDINKLSPHFQDFSRKWFNRYNRFRLKNTDFSLICNNCNGGFLLHDLGLQFRTPTINLWFRTKDYLEFLSNLPQYLNTSIIFSDELEAEWGYPVGILDGKVRIYFQHYHTREEAAQKWYDRCKRVSMENLFIIFTDQDGCTLEDIKRFDELPYNNKVIFTHIPYPEFKSAFYIKGFEQQSSVGPCFTYNRKWIGKKYYDNFPYIRWFNNKLHF